MPPRVTLPPTDREARRIKHSRVLSYALVLLAAVVFSLRPELFGDPQTQPAHALLHVWRIVAGIVLALAAVAVQIVVGVQWRSGLRRAAEDDDPDPAEHTRVPPGNRPPADR
ncbi:hypothetical protein [Curtobacterium pusillum]|uniref:hypothetical protein n=1 Tax=Curtobacterium pusillum TaxID=69373 RepID=UPI0011A544ED|nr:hypothetical protein [Curtobacterium pusillum]